MCQFVIEESNCTMFQAISTPDLALSGNPVAFYARSRSRPGTAMSVTTAEPVFERFTKQGSATHLPSLFTGSRRSLFLPPKRTGSSNTIQSEPFARENRSSVLRQKRAARILQAQRTAVWPHNKKKIVKPPSKPSTPIPFHPPTYDTLQRRFAEASRSDDFNRVPLHQSSPNLSPRLSHYEAEHFDRPMVDDDDQLRNLSASSFLDSPPTHYDPLIAELKLSLNRLEESVRRAQEHEHIVAQEHDQMVAQEHEHMVAQEHDQMVAQEHEHMVAQEQDHIVAGSETEESSREQDHNPVQAADFKYQYKSISHQHTPNGATENIESQLSYGSDHQEQADGLTRRNVAASKIQWYYRRHRSRTNFRRRRRRDAMNNASAVNEKAQSDVVEVEREKSSKTPTAPKAENAPIETERTAALLEDFFNQNTRSSPQKESVIQSDRSNVSTGRNQSHNERIANGVAIDHYKDNFGVLRKKSYDSDEDRSFIASETQSRLESAQGRNVADNASTQKAENGHRDGPSSPMVLSHRSTDRKNQRRISTATLILRSSRSVIPSPRPIKQSPDKNELSNNLDELAHVVNFLEQQMSKDEERRSQISARSMISDKSDVNTVKDSSRSHASSGRAPDSIVDEVLREKHVLINLCTNLLQQVHDIGVQMSRYEHKSELRLQKLQGTIRDKITIPANDQHEGQVEEQIRELNSRHAAEIELLKHEHQQALELQRLMYEKDLATLEKELGEVRERLADVHASISRIPHSARPDSTTSAYVQTEVPELEMINGNEENDAIDSNKQMTDVEENWGALTVEETAILADQYKEIQKEVQSLLSDHDELKTRLLNVVHEKELAEKEMENKDREIARLQKQVQQIGEEQSELNTKLSADLTHEMEELRLSNADLTDQMSRLQNNYETVISRQAEAEEKEEQ